MKERTASKRLRLKLCALGADQETYDPGNLFPPQLQHQARNVSATSGPLDTGLSRVMQNPVNLRGSLKELPHEGSGESTQEESTSAADEFGTPLAGTVGA
jgi:hypothetical protein